MAKRKPCKPKPKTFDLAAYFDYWATYGAVPSKAHVLCPIHVK